MPATQTVTTTVTRKWNGGKKGKKTKSNAAKQKANPRPKKRTPPKKKR